MSVFKVSESEPGAAEIENVKMQLQFPHTKHSVILCRMSYTVD